MTQRRLGMMAAMRGGRQQGHSQIRTVVSNVTWSRRTPYRASLGCAHDPLPVWRPWPASKAKLWLGCRAVTTTTTYAVAPSLQPENDASGAFSGLLGAPLNGPGHQPDPVIEGLGSFELFQRRSVTRGLECHSKSAAGPLGCWWWNPKYSYPRWRVEAHEQQDFARQCLPIETQL